MRRFRFGLYFALLLVVAQEVGAAPATTPAPENGPASASGSNRTSTAATRPFDIDDTTIFLLEPDLPARRLIDRTGRTSPTSKGATVVADDRFGACLKLADGAGVNIPDGGKFSLAGGMTLDAWIYLEEPPPARGATLAVKVGSFAWDLGNGKLNTSWLTFPTEPIATTTPTQYKHYPVGGETINGLMNLPVGRWVLLARPTEAAPKQDPPNPAIHASLRSGGEGKRYLVLANDSRQTETTTVTLGNIADMDAPNLLAKDAPPLSVRAGVVKVTMPALGVGVYQVAR